MEVLTESSACGRAKADSTLRTSRSKEIRSLFVSSCFVVHHQGERVGESARETLAPLWETFPQIQSLRGTGIAILTRVWIDNSLFGSRTTPATKSKDTHAGRSCAGSPGFPSGIIRDTTQDLSSHGAVACGDVVL